MGTGCPEGAFLMIISTGFWHPQKDHGQLVYPQCHSHPHPLEFNPLCGFERVGDQYEDVNNDRLFEWMTERGEQES
jgi:hypothetical protein